MPSSAAAIDKAILSDAEQLQLKASLGLDPLELSRLAHLLGPHALLTIIADENRSSIEREVAIRSLSYVDDVTPALDVLSLLASGASEDFSLAALQTLVQQSRAHRAHEESDTSSWLRTGEALSKIVQMTHHPVRKSLASLALIQLADKHLVRSDLLPQEQN